MFRRVRFFLLLAPLVLFGILVSCLRPAPKAGPFLPAGQRGTTEAAGERTALPHRPAQSPTPDQPRVLPTLRPDPVDYYVKPGDTLGKIAQRYGVPISKLVEVNDIANPDLLSVGQYLFVPAPEPLEPGPAFKIIPDSELVRGPASADFDVGEFVRQYNGYLRVYREELEDRYYSGIEIVERVSVEYSVNPRLLLAVLEYQTGWVTREEPPEEWIDYPMAYPEPWRKGLYAQLAWAANNLNSGYYRWQLNTISHWLLTDGSVIPPDETINAGTAGVQHLMSLLYREAGWREAVSERGVYYTYFRLFGDPFARAVEPVVPDDLLQPPMLLPFEEGVVWYFSGGPHAGWGDGSGWAALDFAPPEELPGCLMADSWVTAVAGGLVTYSNTGTVVLDLDGDGHDQTGWSVLYLHIDSFERVKAGTRVEAGARIGHASCEGGVSNGTHVHLARRYNGEWIAADRHLPFNLEGWISQGTGSEYNGILIRNEDIVEAWDRRREENRIWR